MSATGQWFSPGTPVSYTNKTNRHGIAEIWLKMALDIINILINLCNKCLVNEQMNWKVWRSKAINQIKEWQHNENKTQTNTDLQNTENKRSSKTRHTKKGGGCTRSSRMVGSSCSTCGNRRITFFFFLQTMQKVMNGESNYTNRTYPLSFVTQKFCSG